MKLNTHSNFNSILEETNSYVEPSFIHSHGTALDEESVKTRVKGYEGIGRDLDHYGSMEIMNGDDLRSSRAQEVSASLTHETSAIRYRQGSLLSPRTNQEVWPTSRTLKKSTN